MVYFLIALIAIAALALPSREAAAGLGTPWTRCSVAHSVSSSFAASLQQCAELIFFFFFPLLPARTKAKLQLCKQKYLSSLNAIIISKKEAVVFRGRKPV